jgi:DUF1009 family protein
MKNKRIGLIAGAGALPRMVVEFCQRNQIEAFCVLLKSFASPKDFASNKFGEFSLGQVGKIIGYFKSNGVKEVIFAGGVKRPSFFSIKYDLTGFRLIKKILKNKILGDNTVLETIINFLREYGFSVGKVENYIDNGKFVRGFNGKITFEEKEFSEDATLGKKVLDRLSDLDVGQSVIIQQGSVMGIECVEGTEELIRRSKNLIHKTGRGAILVKMKKLTQTDMADLPSIGTDTIGQLKDSGLIGLVVDYKNCIALGAKEIIELADQSGLFVYGIGDVGQ